jgi:hypothetical protein
VIVFRQSKLNELNAEMVSVGGMRDYDACKRGSTTTETFSNKCCKIRRDYLFIKHCKVKMMTVTLMMDGTQCQPIKMFCSV